MLEKYNWKLLRMQKGLSQKEASKLIGIDPSQLCRYERGSTNPTLMTILKMCKAYNVDPGPYIKEL